MRCQKLEQRLAHIRENLDTRELAEEFEQAHELEEERLTTEHGAQKIDEQFEIWRLTDLEICSVPNSCSDCLAIHQSLNFPLEFSSL